MPGILPLAKGASGGGAWSSITAPTTTAGFTDGGNATTITESGITYTGWKFISSTITTGTVLALVSTAALTSGSLLTATFSGTSTFTGNLMSITSTGTGLSSTTPTGLNISISGANANSAVTATGISVTVSNTNSTSGTNVGFVASVSGAHTNNYGFQSTGSGTYGFYNNGGGTGMSGFYNDATFGGTSSGGSGFQNNGSCQYGFLQNASPEYGFYEDGATTAAFVCAISSGETALQIVNSSHLALITWKATSGAAMEWLDTGNTNAIALALNVSSTIISPASGYVLSVAAVNCTATEAAGAGAGTLSNVPNGTNGNPTAWLKIYIGGTAYVVPCWPG